MSYTLTFDNSVYCKVNGSNANSPYILSNGDVITVSPNFGNFVVNNKTYSASTANTIDISNSDIAITKGGSVPALDPVNTTINFSEATANRISVDMSTLPGWNALTAGEHNITVVAKATGYLDSDPSEAVTFIMKKIPAGTYLFNAAPSMSTVSATFNFTTNGTSVSGLSVSNTGIVYNFPSPIGTTQVYTASTNHWTLDAYRTITITEESEVSDEFYDWAITQGNPVKQAVVTGYTVNVSWTDDYGLWSKLQYSTDSGATWIAMPDYSAGSSGNATITGVEGKIRFKVSGNGGTCSVWKDGSFTGNTITLDGQSPDYTLTANASFELIGSD